MTRFQKIIAGAAIVIAATALFVHQVRLTRAARAEVAKLHAQQTDLTNQIARLQATLAAKDEQLSASPAQGSAPADSSSDSELLKLRAEVTRAHDLERNVTLMSNLLSHQSAPLREWTTNNLSNAGRADPLSAVQTFLYFSQETNLTALKEGLVGDDVDPPDPGEMEKFLGNKFNFDGFGNTVSGVKIISQHWISPEKVQFQVLAEMGDTSVGIAVPFTFRNVNGEWKLTLFNVRDSNGKIQEVNYFGTRPNL